MEWIKWVFSGIGIWFLSAFEKILHREKDDYKGGKHTRFKQIQKGRDSSEQEQIYNIDFSNPSTHEEEEEDTNVVQKQIAGNNSKQTQIGVIKHGN